jgi:glutamate synthase (NADPH/NADH) small chain
MGVEFRLGEDMTHKLDAIEAEFDAVFIGIGLGGMHRLNIPGEDLSGVIDALRFIAEYKTGSPILGRIVVVVGAGNTAIDAAAAAHRLGAEQVHILYRRGEADMSAFAGEYEHAKLSGIRFHWWTRVTQIRGTESVEAIDCGAFTLPCDIVIPALGQSRFKDLGDVNRETGQMANLKYFAGGDCINGGREVVDAVADGKRAALGIVKWLT